MTFGPATPMSFARIFTPRPGRTYDRVTWPNLPVFAETLTFDRYNDDQTPVLPFLRTPNFDPTARELGLMDVGGLGMLTVPVNSFIRAAANGLGGFLGRVMTHDERVEAERLSQQERDRIARAYGSGNTANPGGGRVGPPAPLPPGTTKTPWAAAGDAVANLFGPSVATPPGTEADADTVTSATPPINTSGAPNWGLMVGLGVLVIGGGALAWSIWGKKSAPAANRRRGRGRRRNGRPSGMHEFVVDVSSPGHIERVTIYRGGQAVLSRFLRDIVSFRPTESQRKKIIAGRGRIRITESQITGRY